MTKGKLPFPRFLARTAVLVSQTELSRVGEDIKTVIFDGKAIYDEKVKNTLDAERRLVTLSGKVIIEGDIAPNKLIEGIVEVGGYERAIYRSLKPRNPDGSVFSTELELI